MTYISSTTSDVSSYETAYTSGSISISGLADGTDYSEVVDALVDAQSYKKDEYETQLDEQEYIVGLLEDLSDALDSLQTTLESFDSVNDFLSMDVTSTMDEVSAEADGSAKTGVHSIEVNQLAQYDILVTNTGYAASDSLVSSSGGTLVLSYGDTEYQVSVGADTTLEDLATLITQECNDDITGSVLYDGSNYYLVLTGADSGAENAITVEDSTTVTGLQASDFTNTQECCDAQFKVDGFPTASNAWITRSTNEIDDVLSGVTLNLTGTTDGDTATISIGYDEDGLQENIETFISEVNQIILDIQTITGRVTTYYTTDDGDTAEMPTLGSYALDMMYNNMKSILSSIGQGFIRYDSEDGSGDTFTSLSQLGISTDTEEGSDTFGQLVIDDEDVFADAISQDPYGVALLFAADGESEATNGVVVESTVTSVTQGGEYDIVYTTDASGTILSATIDGEDAYIEGNTLTSTTGDSKGLLVSVTDLTAGAHTSTAYVKQGKTGELIDAIQDMITADDGTLTLLIDSCEENIDSLEDDIYYEEKRLDLLESTLTQKYANLESVLSEYSSISDTLDALTTQLAS